MKRGMSVFVLLSLVFGVLFMSMSFVSAQSGPIDAISRAIGSVVDFIEPVTALIVGATPGGEFLFVKILLMIIVFSIVWIVLKNFDFFSEHNRFLVLISLIVTILAVRFLDSTEAISTILLPYSTLGIAITAGIPFIVYSLVINVGFKGPHKLIRRVAWIFFASIFIFLWFVRWNDIGNLGRFIYPLTAVASIVMLFLDGTINGLLTQMKIEKAQSQNKEELLTEIQRKINQANDDLANGVITSAQRNQRVGRYRKQIADLSE
jgi:hypothetical protein